MGVQSFDDEIAQVPSHDVADLYFTFPTKDTHIGPSGFYRLSI